MPKIFIPLCENFSLWAFHNGFLFGKLKVLSQSPKTNPVIGEKSLLVGGKNE
jgi:hypothetical protein